jgi:DNA-binding NtrC family response regulator
MNTSAPPRKPVVLVVEDETLLLFYATEFIEAAGFEVLSAANADEAITLLNTRADIRVVFTDVDMPGTMDGLKLAQAVRERWPPVELIVTSGHVEVPKDKLPARGRFFSKPYDPEEVVATIRRFAA